jgi:hypothetical protein
MSNDMITKKSWKDFKETGLLWFINTILHTFGWAICVEVDDNSTVTNAYPARVKFRGFSEASNTNGYINVSKYLQKNIDELTKEAEK